MIARIASIPLIIWLAFNLYQVYGLYNNEYQIWLVPPILLLAILFVSHRELDKWILGDGSKDLDQESTRWLEKFSPVYKTLNEELKDSVRVTVQKIIDDTMFINMNDDKFPDDAGLAVALDQALLRTALDEKLVDTYVLYTHPFLTPNISEKVHACEFEPEDKVIILSAEQLLPGLLDPYKYLNISLYSQASALLSQRSFDRKLNDHEIPPSERLAALIGQEPEMIKKWTGLDEINEKALLIYTYFYFPENLKKEFPGSYALMNSMFGIFTD